MQPDPDRKMQVRLVSSRDEMAILQRSTRALSLMGYTVNASDGELGLVAARKEADVEKAGEVVAAAVIAILLTGPANMRFDSVERTYGSVVLRPFDSNRTEVRMTAARFTFTNTNRVSKAAAITDPLVYRQFFDGMALPEWIVEEAP